MEGAERVNVVQYEGAPSFTDIINCACDTSDRSSKSYKRFAKDVKERLIECMFGGAQFPMSILNAACHKVTRPMGYDNIRVWRRDFMHTDRPGRASLALDLVEEFRPVLADRFVLTLVNTGAVKPGDFEIRENGGVLLSDFISDEPTWNSMSLSLRRAWIEIATPSGRQTLVLVALLTESVD